jgi:hypothetical protein
VADKALIDVLVEFADALQAEGIDPRLVDVLLPTREWYYLANLLEEEQGGPLQGDEAQIEVHGVRYLVKIRGEGAVAAR